MAAPPQVRTGQEPASPEQNLLATKLYVPRARRRLVARPALLSRLDAGMTGDLTLVSAPAGFGKTTLVAAWAGASQRPVAWLSLDAADNDPSRFLGYLVAALRTVDPRLGADLLAALQSLRPVDSAASLTGLLNEITAREEPLALVLDDYHLIEDEAVHAAVRFLIDNMPAQMHLVICTREDPPWPLGRLRAGGRVREIRGRDLRFSLAETADFCNEVMGLGMSPQEIDILDARAEGWVAGLQLAALSLQGAGDMERLLQGFTGSSRYVLDYLLEEVLERQPPPVQDFLLRTAVLERFNASLCSALLAVGEPLVTREGERAAPGAQQMLEELEAANLFIVPLDEQRRWYRYHHLFAGLLRARLERLHPQAAARLHSQAARWFAKHGAPEEAISHALAAADHPLAAGIIEREGMDLVSRHKMVSLARWLEALPETVLDERPWLCLFMAYTRHWLGDRAVALGARLDQAERALQRSPPADSAEKRRLRGYIASLRAQDALSAGKDPALIIRQAKLALELLPPGDLMGTEAGVSMGGAFWIQGDASAAEAAFAAGRDTAKRCGKYLMAVPTATYAGWQQMKQGQLARALVSFEEALAWATQEDGHTVPVGGFPLLRISDVQYEWRHADAARRAIERGIDLCLRLNQADVVVDAHATYALRLWSAGRHEAAWEEVRRGDDRARDSSPDKFLLARLDTCRVRLLLAEGRVADALAWLGSQGPDPGEPLSFHHDLHHLLAVRIWLAAGRPDDALQLARRIADAARGAGWVWEAVQALALAAVAAQRGGDTEQALALLQEALRLGAPGCFVSTLLDEGPLVAGLLRQVSPSEQVPAPYLQRLLAQAGGPQPGAVAGVTAGLVEPLSERELQILALIAQGLTNSEIAARLVLSLATVKWHAGNIYGKLGVGNRSQAVAQARELGILD